MFTVAFTIAKIRKQPKCPSTDKWKKFMLYTMEYLLLNHKKNEILPFVTWMDLEGIMVSELCQREGQIPSDLPYMWNLENK